MTSNSDLCPVCQEGPALSGPVEPAVWQEWGNWQCPACGTWIRNSARRKLANQRHRVDQVQTFLADVTEPAQDEFICTTDLWAAFQVWNAERRRFRMQGRNRFLSNCDRCLGGRDVVHGQKRGWWDHRFRTADQGCIFGTLETFGTP